MIGQKNKWSDTDTPGHHVNMAEIPPGGKSPAKRSQNIQDIVSAYFLAQRVKVPAADDDKEAYLAKLTLCHKVIVAAMKCKQSADAEAVKALHDLLHDFEKTFGS